MSKNLELLQIGFEDNLCLMLRKTAFMFVSLRGIDLNVLPPKTIELIFHSDCEENCINLGIDLFRLNYYVGVIDKSKIGDGGYFVRAWTPKIKVTEERMLKLTREMCSVALENDCWFKDWRTCKDDFKPRRVD